MTTETTTPAPEKGTYEFLRDRLHAQATTLRERAESLNAKRVELFGSTELRVLGTERIRTANNCVPRDIVQVGELLLFGYNVFLGLRKEIDVPDVLALHEVVEDASGEFSFPEVRADDPRSFLRDATFQKDFRELYKYYKNARLLQLRRTETKLLAVFQTGQSVTDDLKVLRWAVSPDGAATYVDNRGERDHVYPPQHDFEWTRATREDFVQGRHPHVSILDEVFVETVGGDLTVKVEDNTEDGLGIYREPVDDADQSLDDAEIRYAKLGSLILLEVRPYNEKRRRYLVFNTRTHQVDRIDAIGQSCVQLPEDHGLVFPGGYYLQSGETKTFEAGAGSASAQMELERAVRSPNGEDVLYVFHERRDGRAILLPYNLIRKQVQNPIHCHGACLFDDGKMVLFRSASEEPVRVHPMQVWQTPFCSPEHAAAAPRTGSHLEKVGNADLVRGISDALALARTATETTPSVAVFEELVAAAGRMQDAYYWLGHDEVGDLRAPIVELQKTADLVVGEFQKVEEARGRARDAALAAERRLAEVERGLDPGSLESVDAVVGALAELRRQRGQVRSVGEMRYADAPRLAALEARIVEETGKLTAHAADLLARPESFAGYRAEIEALAGKGTAAARVADLEPVRERLAEVAAGLELLTEVTTQLEIADATVRTAVLEAIAAVMATSNRGRAEVEARRRELLEREGRAEFAAQFQLLAQSVSGALAMAASPERCDEELTRLLLQMEELESRFGEIDELLAQLTAQREEIVEAFAAKKQTLLDERQRASDRLLQAAERILEGVVRRAAGLGDQDALHAFFAGDAMIQKLRDLARRLRELGAVVRADEVDTRLQTARQEAQRTLRDRLDLYESGGATIRLGRHRFSVNTRPVELTLVPRQGGVGQTGGLGQSGGEPEMTYHLAGTDYYETATDPELAGAREHWPQLLVSETDDVYRGEYLAYTLLHAAEEERDGLTLEALLAEAADPAALAERVRKAAAERYDEGYERGVHDHDAAVILGKLLGLYATADLLRFPPRPRAWAALFWAFSGDTRRRVLWERRAKSLARLRTAFAHSRALAALQGELGDAVADFLTAHGVAVHADDARLAGAYLFEELARPTVRFVTSAEATALQEAMWRHLGATGGQRELEEDLRELADDLGERVALATAWVTAFLDEASAEGGDGDVAALRPALEETVALLLTDKRLDREPSGAQQTVVVNGLLGHHPRIVERRMSLRLDEVLARLSTFHQRRVPAFRAYQALRHRLLEAKRRELRLAELQPRVMSAFVRNRLIDEAYLPLVGDNLAKQLGALAAEGAGKRVDQMGLLLLISPPGYGKTTLMEYVASRLGLVFVKVDGPALGHRVTSLDPAEAPNATARREVEKANLALAMGNNVLLYLDDVQHTSAELLQKFISLCDAQRKIEGVWRGETRTFDLRGKRFAVVMAGNPYTESGQRFRIPDMLANRADTYNLGDVLQGRDEVFALSYLENAMTSNPVLAPLAGRPREDFHLLARMARGEAVPKDRLEHPYSPAELEDILAVLRRLVRVQEVVLAVNRQYIASAAQEDAYRTEPRFQLQGSYRNMNRLAEKVVPVMNDAELEALLDDHYAGEAQTLTSGAEANVLKLRELRGVLTEEEARRWEEVKRGFRRVQTMGGPEEDPAVKVVGQLGLVSERLEDIGTALVSAGRAAADRDAAAEGADDGAALRATLGEVVAPWLAGLQRNLELLAENAAEKPGNGEAAILALSPDVAARLDALSDRLAALATAAPAASAPAPLGVDLGVAPYLERLDGVLRLLADRPTAGLALGPEVAALLDKLATAVGETLLPLVQKLGRHAKKTAAPDRATTDLVDRTLKTLDHMKTLVAALQRRPGVGDATPGAPQVATEA